MMNRPIRLALVTLIALGCGGAPTPEPTTASATAEPPEAPPGQNEAPSGTVEDDGPGAAVVTQESPTTAAPTGDVLDKEAIRRVVQAELPAVRKCYEAGLLSRPELAGKLTVSFQIEATGSVSSASASGLGDARVESCVSSVIEGVQFPADQDRGIVVVNYPFTLRPKPD
jgi:hypothetical protein